MIEIIIAAIIQILATGGALPADAQHKEQTAPPQAAALTAKSDTPQPIINPGM